MCTLPTKENTYLDRWLPFSSKGTQTSAQRHKSTRIPTRAETGRSPKKHRVVSLASNVIFYLRGNAPPQLWDHRLLLARDKKAAGPTAGTEAGRSPEKQVCLSPSPKRIFTLIGNSSPPVSEHWLLLLRDKKAAGTPVQAEAEKQCPFPYIKYLTSEETPPPKKQWFLLCRITKAAKIPAWTKVCRSPEK